jgi:hypothetical protein
MKPIEFVIVELSPPLVADGVTAAHREERIPFTSEARGKGQVEVYPNVTAAWRGVVTNHNGANFGTSLAKALSKRITTIQGTSRRH